jgi:hypothetical protein
MNADELERRLGPSRLLSPQEPAVDTTAWIRSVDSGTISFTIQDSDQAHLYILSIRDGSCRRVFSCPRPAQTSNVWKTCEIQSSGGRLYTLTSPAPDRHVVTDVSQARTVELPIHPPPDAAIDTVADFWADASRIVYLNLANPLSDEHLVVACDWEGRVEWTLGLGAVFTDIFIYLWEVSLCPQPDGTFIVFFNGEAYPEGRDSELTVGLLWLRGDGSILESFRLPWWPAIFSEGIHNHIDGGGGFLLDHQPVLVAHLFDSGVLRTRTGTPLEQKAIHTTHGHTKFIGTVNTGEYLVIAQGNQGVSVYDLRGRSGLEPSLRDPDGPSGLEPSL